MRVYGTFVFVLWLFATVVAQNTPDVCSSTAQEPSVTSLRALNTAEMGFAGQHRRFASVSELLSDANAKSTYPCSAPRPTLYRATRYTLS
jgi:hypothetical protein